MYGKRLWQHTNTMCVLNVVRRRAQKSKGHQKADMFSPEV